MTDYKHKDLTHEIINAAHMVHNQLGDGFLEKVYHNSLFIELKNRGLAVQSEKPIKVHYDNQIVGEFSIDLLVENKVVLEIKAVEKSAKFFSAQLLNYLKAAGHEVGLIINFAKSVEVKRMVL